MKNPHVERCRLAAKHYHRQNPGAYFDGGIEICHVYDELEAERLTWWDDVRFILNDYRVALMWKHPRMAYQDRVEEEAFNQAEHLRSAELFGELTPCYAKHGRSRKKITAWRSDGDRGRLWFDAVCAAEMQLAQVADYRITPSISVQWGRYSRMVSLCAPVEVRNEDDLRALAMLAKRILKRQTSLQDEFPGYVYTREDWVREGLASRKTGIHSHQVG